MNKETTTKEALNNLCDLATPNGDCINYVIGLSGIILKALDRLEALEHENKKWREIVGCDLCEALGREILLEENEKFKKKINDLKTLTQEKIENANNDYWRCFENPNPTKSKNDILKGEILAYIDILILLKEVLE